MSTMTDDNSTTDRDAYNGWANRETWAFNLHWQNDQGLYNMVLEFAVELIQRMSIASHAAEGPSDRGLGEQVVNYVTEELPELSPELWENMRTDVGSFWRINHEEVGATVRESIDTEG